MRTANLFPDQQTTEARVEADVVERLGYRQRFARTLRHFESFAVAFSFISITTGIFTTFGFLLGNAGPRGIWTWPIVIVGQALVALVYGALVARIPLAGYSYQWASRLAGPNVGWWMGWLSFSFLSIVTVSVDYAFTQVAFMPLVGLEYTPTTAAVITLVVIGVQASMIIWSTPVITRVNNTAVTTEILGVVQLVIIMVVAGVVARTGHLSNLWSTGVVPAEGWYRWLGPFMLATLLGAYTIVGFESSANLAEETQRPRRVVPKTMVQAVIVSGALGMAFLIALTLGIGDVAAISEDPSPVAAILKTFFGQAEALPLVWMCISIFACGMVIMTTNSRLIWAMARDRRFPGYQVLARTPRATGGPMATLLAAAISASVVIVLRTNTEALFTLFATATLMPASLYAGTVLLYLFTMYRRPAPAGTFQLGRWETPVVLGAFAWLVYELIVLIAPAEFRPAQRYALGTVAVGVVVYLVMRILEPSSMRRRAGGERELWSVEGGDEAETGVRAETDDGAARAEPDGNGTRPEPEEGAARRNGLAGRPRVTRR
jgi:amino acid transporter